jgi:hypothetical protein
MTDDQVERLVKALETIADEQKEIRKILLHIEGQLKRG